MTQNVNAAKLFGAFVVQAQHRVMRGTWYVEKGQDWVPLRETIADELETAFSSEVGTASPSCSCVGTLTTGSRNRYRVCRPTGSAPCCRRECACSDQSQWIDPCRCGTQRTTTLRSTTRGWLLPE